MAKGSRGGRRGAGGGVGRQINLDKQDFAFNAKIPELSGSEKQKKWASDIRSQLAQDLLYYTISRGSKGGALGGRQMVATGQKGTKAIEEEILNSSLVKMTTGKVKTQKINDAINGYKDLSERIGRLNKLFSDHSDSKFWIDNRNANYKFKNYIDGKKEKE